MKVNPTIHTAEQLRNIAAQWQAKADAESGKTEEGGWWQWERDAADRRREYCLAKRDACLAKLWDEYGEDEYGEWKDEYL